MAKVFLLLSITLVTFCGEALVRGAATCSTLKQFDTSFVPACDAEDLSIHWPSYENASAYYVCIGLNRPVMISCPPDQYFIFVLQGCGSCVEYIPPVECEKLPTEKPSKCGGQSGANTTSANKLPTPRYPSSTASTTPSSKPPIKPTTERPTKPTRTPTPTPTPTRTPTPTKSSTSASPSSPTIPPPPSPATTNPDVPQPPTPQPTPPIVPVSPPQVKPKPSINLSDP